MQASIRFIHNVNIQAHLDSIVCTLWGSHKYVQGTRGKDPGKNEDQMETNDKNDYNN